MRQFIITLIAAIFSVSSFAQNIAEKSLDGKDYIEVAMNCQNTNVGDIKIMLEGKSALKLIKDLRKVQTKAEQCAEIAEKNNVKSYNKTLVGSYSFSKLGFCNENGMNVAEYNSNNYLAPYFNVDSEGNSHITFGGYYACNNTDMGSNDKRTKFFFYMSIPVNELDSWINNLEIAANDINHKQKGADEINEIFMAMK